MTDRGKPVRVLTWADYVIDDVARLVFDRSGVDVLWEIFDQNEDAYHRLKAAPDQYDVVFADGLWPRRYFNEELVLALDPSQFQSWEGVDPIFQRQCVGNLWPAGPGRMSAYPGNWGLRGIVWDPRHVRDLASWLDLWDAPERHLWVNSQGSEVIAETALALGVSAAHVYELGPKELVEVTDKLVELAPRVGGTWTAYPELARAFETGEAWIAEVHTTALVSNLEWLLGRSLKATVPKEGTVAYIDGAMVSAASHNPAGALAFIDTMFSPEAIELQWRRSDGYASTNRVAMARLASDLRFKDKIERAASTPEAMFDAVLYRTPQDIHGYLTAWRTVLQAWRPPAVAAR